MGEVRFDGKVAIVTGAGGGLGRSHALTLASKGAKVVVNDLGGTMDGSGSGSAMADKVVDEIKASGGEAVANYDGVDTVEGGKNIVKTAIDAFGKVDILINNAGILRDKTFAKMDEQNWDMVVGVHMKGAYCVTYAAWPYMRENAYGRIVLTASGAGLFGNFGQANYGAAKSAMLGFMNVLKLEGAKYNIKTNTIAPIATSRMTESLMPPEIHDKLKPEFVTPLVAYLCSEDCEETGGIYTVGGGHFARIALMECPGYTQAVDKEITVDDIKNNFASINSIENMKYYASLADENVDIMAKIMK
ncbi:MAG: SDR family oxidoreductase [Desulfobacterales bacterium]|jgi:NAD(P)-dependent dehydrogenase (short-subunit alcohol dehydrogenase family)|nr:SDR family oxidoreductase [Desulfobacterales bacterium]